MRPRIDVARGSRYSQAQIPVLVAIANPRSRKAALESSRAWPRAAETSSKSIVLRLRGAEVGAFFRAAGSEINLMRMRNLRRDSAASPGLTDLDWLVFRNFARYGRTSSWAKFTASLRDAALPNRDSQDGARCVPHRARSWAKFSASLRDALPNHSLVSESLRDALPSQSLLFLPRAGRIGRLRRNANLEHRSGGRKTL